MRRTPNVFVRRAPLDVVSVALQYGHLCRLPMPSPHGTTRGWKYLILSRHVTVVTVMKYGWRLARSGCGAFLAAAHSISDRSEAQPLGGNGPIEAGLAERVQFTSELDVAARCLLSFLSI
jgi:hypothetical protein